jgi:hypothetical protein
MVFSFLYLAQGAAAITAYGEPASPNGVPSESRQIT